MLRQLVAWAFLAMTAASAAPVSYVREVQPILTSRCAACHQSTNPSGNVSLAVAPSMGVAKLVLQAVSGHSPRMPKAGSPLSEVQVAVLGRWVAEGAVDDSKGAAPEVWWSLRPLLRPSVPAPGNAVDAFVQSALRAKGLTPSAEAERRVLIRRLTFDLHGLPPTPEEVRAFVEDRSPKAYEALVDRLLGSPRYGERWARHWLDVVHYGDSHGYDKDKPRANAWPYRDYVIAALNRDKPYSRFVREQIAGDVLFPNNAEAFTATGFLAAGPWDFVGHQELREGTTDKDNTRLLDRDDMVATTMSTFVSMTAHCARCHNHKFDPIPQEDYYNLQAVFAGVDRADRPFDEDPAVNAQRQTLVRKKAAMQLKAQPVLDKVEFASSPELTELDASLQDAKLLLAHLGTPKNVAETEDKAQLQAKVSSLTEKRKALVISLAGADVFDAGKVALLEIEAVDREIAKLPPPRYVYSGASYFPRAGTFRPSLQPRPVHVLDRGSVVSPKQEATPGTLRCVPELTAKFAADSDEGQRRAALANWIADDRNILTWRSIVNRVWHYHFGAGLVDSPNDFGKMGAQPSHPELLDWLAVWFRDDAHGSLKQLHKLLVMSATYRQSSSARAEGLKADADNRLLWRMNRTRLDAEAVRDSTLSVAGNLDFTAGGPGVRWFAFKDDHSPVYDYAKFDPDAPGAHRRSIYRFVVRSVPDPLMERLDCPDPSVLTPKRSTTLTAIQALAMWNNPFVVRSAEHFAARLRTEGAELPAQIERALQLAAGRSATAAEIERYGAYASKHGLESLCRVLLNTSEFLFVD